MRPLRLTLYCQIALTDRNYRGAGNRMVRDWRGRNQADRQTGIHWTVIETQIRIWQGAGVPPGNKKRASECPDAQQVRGARRLTAMIAHSCDSSFKSLPWCFFLKSDTCTYSVMSCIGNTGVYLLLLFCRDVGHKVELILALGQSPSLSSPLCSTLGNFPMSS